MLGHGAKFSHRKEQVIAALLLHKNLDAAARAVGISVNTLRRWMKDPEFDSAYRERAAPPSVNRSRGCGTPRGPP